MVLSARTTRSMQKIQLDEPIKNVGEYKVPVRLHRE
jgi:ribosomal protein L9